jgi:hypothetical protein
MPVTTVQNIPDSPDISLNDVSFTSMTVHMETVYAETRMQGFDVSWIPHDVPWIVLTMPRMSTSLVWTKLQHILSMAKEESSRNQRKLADASATTVQNSVPDISLNDVFTSMTVHMETVYAADKNVGFDVSWIPHDGAMDSSMPPMSTSRNWTKRYNFLWLGEKFRRNRANSAYISATTEQSAISDNPVISFNDVSSTSMTVHMDTVYADKNVTIF